MNKEFRNSWSPPIFVTKFGKMCIVHTSDFAHLEIHKNHSEWYIDVKLSGIIKNSSSTIPESFTCIHHSK